jgi:acetyl esterase
MPLDPQAQAFLDLLASFEGPGIEEMGPEVARQMFAGMTSPAEGGVASIEDRSIPGPDGADIPVRIYTPEGDGPFPLHVTYHGGGFVIGNLDTHQALAQGIAVGSRSVVVSVDYRLAPEHPYPAANEDCYAATAWAHEHAAELGADPDRLTVGGDSAGGNLAAVVCLMARDRSGPPIRLQALIYPVCDHRPDRYPSHEENGEGYFLTASTMQWFTECYLQGQDLHAHNAPIVAEDLAGLPPALVITAEFDPLRDEGEAYGTRLEQAGVPTTVSRYDGMIHGFASMPSLIDRARDAHAEISAAIGDATATNSANA